MDPSVRWDDEVEASRGSAIPMRIARPAAERGHTRTGWLDSRHSFSFGHYHDRDWMGWGPLRVINEDRVAPGAGFPPHRHANMEILSYVIDGALAHRDSILAHGEPVEPRQVQSLPRTRSGNERDPLEGMIRAGEWQWMSAGHGVEHSEYNGSDTAPMHFLQIWIQPDRLNAPPVHAQRAFDVTDRRGRWATFASPDGSDGSLAIRQQAWVRGVALGDSQCVDLTLQSTRRYWLQVVQGAIEVDGSRLSAGDAMAYVEEARELAIVGRGDGNADVLLFDLPP